MTDDTLWDWPEPPLPPCRHCGLAVERHADGHWWHRSTARRECWRGGFEAEPPDEVILAW